ncbi:MAG: tail fiber protein [Candidatus Delongbacteria bacterium]|nr:tail fiber protein [Candidatus Delongbacteria bacterium]MBN2836305.1 tail fiber protein [Candidatus Delongbacteria bacterium]
MQPYLVLNFCIALSGIFPSHSKSDEVKGADPFVGEVNIFAFNFTPRDYQSCNGDLLSLSQNTALFSLVGTTYGGNGTSTFGIPDFTGRVVLHRGQGIGLTNRILGEKQGENYHTLTIAEIPSHNHQLKCSSENKSESLSGSQFSIYPNGYNNTSNVYINSGVVSSFGGNQGHNNMMPYLALNYCLATVGVFPPRP